MTSLARARCFRASHARQCWLRCTATATLALLTVAQAHAQTTGTGGAVGEGAWNAVKNLWFGAPGLVLGSVIFALAVYFFFKEGVLAVLGVIGAGTLFFFVPAISVAVQNWAKAF